MGAQESKRGIFNNKALKRKLYSIIFESDTKIGKLFDIVLIVCILLSILLAIVESIEGLWPEHTRLFITFEYIFTG